MGKTACLRLSRLANQVRRRGTVSLRATTDISRQENNAFQTHSTLQNLQSKMASLTNEQLTRYATMPAAINQTRKSASQPTKPTSSTPPPLNTSNESEPNPPTATATLEESNLSDLSDPETKDPRTWKRPSKKRKRPSSVVNIDDLQSVFHYDGATRRNMAPKIVYPQDQQILGRLTTQPWIQEAQKLQMEEKKEKRAKTSNTTTTHKSKNDDENDDLRFTHPFAPTLVAPPKKNLMPLKDRKRFFIYTPTPTILRAMATHVSEIHALFPPSYPIGHCMLHPSPPPCHIDGRARQTLTYNYAWKDRGGGGGGVRGGGGGEGVHEVKVNYGIIALLVNSRLSAVQKEGWIEESWHLSHLCGNWICCNWRHYTVEDGPTNISREFYSPPPFSPLPFPLPFPSPPPFFGYLVLVLMERLWR